MRNNLETIFFKQNEFYGGEKNLHGLCIEEKTQFHLTVRQGNHYGNKKCTNSLASRLKCDQFSNRCNSVNHNNTLVFSENTKTLSTKEVDSNTAASANRRAISGLPYYAVTRENSVHTYSW